MFPKKGNLFRVGNGRENGGMRYPAMIAGALRNELGRSHRATKTVMQWTGASERTVKHWLAGRYGPNGEYLIVLMRESESVLEAVLTAAGRRDAVVAARVLAAHGTMLQVVGLVEREGFGPSNARSMGAEQPYGLAQRGLDDRINGTNDRNRVPRDVSPESGLNRRQRWYFHVLATGREVRAEDLRRHWGVSERTARRDIAVLEDRGMIEFVGPLRTGRYRLRR